MSFNKMGRKKLFVNFRLFASLSVVLIQDDGKTQRVGACGGRTFRTNESSMRPLAGITEFQNSCERNPFQPEKLNREYFVDEQ